MTTPVTPALRRDFIVNHTTVATAPLVPEVRLYLATEVTPLWQSTEELLARVGLPPPFWAFCWPGGQAIARHVLDHPHLVAGRSVLDFAAGGGVASIAAIRSGATRVTATEIDPFAIEALHLNARLNDTAFEISDGDVIDQDAGWDVVFAGDVCYERPVAERIVAWLRRLASRGALVLLGDPGRTYMPREGLDQIARYVVPTSRDLEEHDSRDTGVWRVRSFEAPSPAGQC